MTEVPAPQTCPEHPDQVSRIHCTRCGRPVCTECMVPAAVGFQCPECVQAAAPPAPRTIAGGSIISKPLVTYVLIGVNVVLFLIQLSSGINEIARQLGMWPIGIALGDQWWRFPASAFLHGSWIHIAFNMYVLFIIGPTLERILGHMRFLLLYVIAAMGGAITSYVLSDVSTVSVGASGAIFGLMGALVVAGQRLRYDIRMVLVLLVINIVIGFLAPNIDWRAHLGGLVTGALVAAIMVLPKRKHRLIMQSAGLLAVVIGLFLLAAWRTNAIVTEYGPYLVIN